MRGCSSSALAFLGLYGQAQTAAQSPGECFHPLDPRMPTAVLCIQHFCIRTASLRFRCLAPCKSYVQKRFATPHFLGSPSGSLLPPQELAKAFSNCDAV
jgi:hypothetical protein